MRQAPLVAFLLLVAGPAHAQSYQITHRDIDPEAMRALLARGELALVESEGDQVKQTVIYALVDAPRERVYDVLAAVDQYPDFIRSIAATKITKRKGPMFSYQWELKVPLISLKGTRLQRGRRPTLIEVRALKGNFKQSRERWELYPIDGGKKTVVAFYRTIDVETGGFVIKTLAGIEPSFGQALSLASSFVHMRSVQRRAAGLPPMKTPKERNGLVPEFLRLDPVADLKPLAPLLKHGNVALIQSHDDGSLRQVVIVSRVASPRQRLVSILQAPDDFPKFMRNFAEQSSTPIGKNRMRLEWELEVPFKNLEGTSLMIKEPDGSVEVVNESGDVPRGRFRWEFFAENAAQTVTVHYSYTDIAKASFFTKLLTEKEPLFAHGAVIASATIALTAVKARAELRRGDLN